MGGGTAAGDADTSAAQLLLSMNDFANFKQIGKGKDCVVYSASCEKLGGHTVVLKVYDKQKISAIKSRSIRREARIMRYLTDKRIPHTTAYTGAFQDSKQIYIVMEHCKGGDLLEQLLKEGRAMPEKRVVREVVLPSLTALAHLHAAGIIHRDIKLENLFISSRGHLQLGDFGLAISVLEERAISPVGTLEYMAPEILRLPSTDLVLKGLVRVEDIAPIDEKVDVWSFGVTVYELVTGRSPFEGASKDEIKAAILGFQMRPLPGFLTPGCQDFILKCLCPKAGDRPSALALLSHPWVQLHCTPADLVTIGRLPLQLPKVPMGYKQPSSSSATAQQQRAQQQHVERHGQAGAEAAASTCSSTVVSAATSPGMTPRLVAAAVQYAGAEALNAAVVSGKTSSAGFGQGPEAKIHANSSTTSGPDSPQIPAFVPAGGPAAPSSMLACGPCSSPSVVSAAYSQVDAGRTCSSSRSSHSSMMMQSPSAASHGVPSIDHTVSSDSARSGALSTADSVASIYQQSLATIASGIVSGNCSSQQHGVGKGWVSAAAAGGGGSAAVGAANWAQEPIQESPTDESAAAAASTTGRSDNASFTGKQQQQQQQQQQFLSQYAVQHPPEAASLQPAQEELQQTLLEHLSSGKARVPAAANGQQQKQKKPQNGGKRLFKWMCIAAGAASPNVSS